LDISNGNWQGDCDKTNENQQFYWNPITGKLKNAKLGTCLRANQGGSHYFSDCKDNHVDLVWWRKENLLQSRNQDCLDIGNPNHHWGCDGNNMYQTNAFI
jgi:hypothetical protein